MKRLLPLLLMLVAAAFAGWRLLSIANDIRRQSTIDEARPADVIVVLGAAEYRGRPSPVYRARLDHGLTLYRKGLAPKILTTGGAGGDPVFTEGEVGRAYLVSRNIPSEAILVEPEGASTAESATAVAEIMRRNELRSCIVVSDGYHIYRVKKMLQGLGLTVYGSPRYSQTGEEPHQWWLYLRQAVGYVLWSAGIRM